METLWAELARAKEQARNSDAAAKKAVSELKAEQAAHRRSEEKIANMAFELKDAANRYELLKKESQEKMVDLQKRLDLRSEQLGRSSGKPARSRLGSPFYCELSSAIRSMLLLIKCGVLKTRIWICQRVPLMQRSSSRIKTFTK